VSRLTELVKQERVCVPWEPLKRLALLDFYDTYFHFPIYKDAKWDIYHAMGGRKISTWNLLKNTSQALKRYKKRNIINIPVKGDLWTQSRWRAHFLQAR
jgi:hypothetical protein